MRFLGTVAVVVVVAGGVYLLREATMSTHYDTDPDSHMTVVVRAASNRSEPGVTREQMAAALIDTCALEVSGTRVGVLEPVAPTDDRFRVTLRPSLDSTDRKQLRGCLEDWAFDNLQLHVESMTDTMAAAGGGGA